MKKLKHLDLFSGIGGFSLGLERTGGFKTVAFCEIDPFCQKILKKHWPEVPLYDDVRTISYTGRVDIITSGDPCQRDSRANAKRDGASMWKYSFEQVKKHRPFFVLRENVLGNVDTGTALQVEGDLASAGYTVRTYVISASAVGAAHNRPRTWTMAHSNGARCEKLDNASQPGKARQWVDPVLTGPDGLCWVGSESPVLRRVDDVPQRLDRIRALGNSVVPSIPELFGRAIMEMGPA